MAVRIPSFGSLTRTSSPASGASISPLLGPTSLASKHRPTLAAIISSKTVRSALLSILALITLFSFTRRFDEPPNTYATQVVALDDPAIDWSQFAYVQYVTNEEYLCNSIMLFEALHSLGSRPDRVMLYRASMLEDPQAPMPSAPNHNATLLIRARDEYNVTLIPIDILSRNTTDETWSDSFTKLLAFNLTSYARVLSLDSDALLLRSMDELFLLTPAPVVMPLAYWLLPHTRIFSSYILLIQPSSSELTRVMEAVRSAGPEEYDMEILNKLYGETAMVLPHRPYGLLTQEFRAKPDEHVRYLGSAEDEVWDAGRVFDEAKYVHFSDWPMTKPWLPISAGLMAMMQPKCWEGEGESWARKCVERDLWHWFYREFRERRMRLCSAYV